MVDRLRELRLYLVSADKVSSAGPQFCQAARHIATLSSSGLRVKVATGGDPVFPLKIHLQGEQVLGSGNLNFKLFSLREAKNLLQFERSFQIPFDLSYKLQFRKYAPKLHPTGMLDLQEQKLMNNS